jgi:hypothetical protein
MSKPQHTRRGFVDAARGAASVALVLLAMCVAATGAQSGRHSQKTSTQPLPEATPQGESESKSGASSKPSDAVVSFAVMEYNGALIGASSMWVDDLADIFARRLGQPKAVSVTRAGKGGRSQARDRAKKETDTYVVLFQIDEDTASPTNRTDYAILVKTYVYEPKTGALKYADTIYQRPYRSTASVGGVRIPLPTSRRIEQYPGQLQLEQAASDAADRLMSRFHVAPPPENQ